MREGNVVSIDVGREGRSDAAPPAEEASLRDKAVSAALWAAGASWLVPMMGSMMALQTVFSSDRIDWLNRLYCRGQVALTGSRWRAVVHPDVDPQRQYMFLQNHVNHFDHCTMYCATPHFKQGVELEKHFEYPVYGWFMRQRGTIPVRPGSKESLKDFRARVKAEVERGHSILAFPEGHRTRDGRVREFQRGLFAVARAVGVPIAPVAVTGMQHVMRADSWIIRPGHTVTVYVEKPIETKGLSVRDVPALTDQVRDVIAARVEAYLEGEA